MTLAIIIEWAVKNQITLQVRYIPGNLNIWADKLSIRLNHVMTTEWSIDPQVIKEIMRTYDPQPQQ